MNYLLAFNLCSWLLITLAITTSIAQDPPYKAVNLGGWLVVEGWMTPDLFQHIPNGDLLDGTQVQLRSTSLNRYLSAENGGGSDLVANRPNASGWETFRLWRIDANTFNLRVFNKDFVGLTNSNRATAQAQPGGNGNFVLVRSSNDRVRIRSSNGFYLQALSESSVTADYRGDQNDWSDQNPSVFDMKIVGGLQGEYQLTNGYGQDAPSRLRNHWNTFITADDFRFISQHGLNAVRIPVGWWIRYGDNPPKPFVGGSLQALDNAFTWAEQNNLKVIVDLHAAPGSQNGESHSAARDGYREWGVPHIAETVEVIDFLAQRYGNRRGLAAIELLNEPWAPEISLDDLTNYYRQGYDAVRKYTQTAYVILSNRLGEVSNTELVSFARGLSRSVIDVHFYNMYSSYFGTLNIEQQIQYIHSERAKSLGEVTQDNGPLSFVGEWTGEFGNGNGSPEDYQRYSRAQLDVYSNATFGWAYWSYKCDRNHWSLKWMIENNHINLQ